MAVAESRVGGSPGRCLRKSSMSDSSCEVVESRSSVFLM